MKLANHSPSPYNIPDMNVFLTGSAGFIGSRLAKALILEQPAEALAKFLDTPWCRADEYHIQKLAMLCGARN